MRMYAIALAYELGEKSTQKYGKNLKPHNRKKKTGKSINLRYTKARNVVTW